MIYIYQGDKMKEITTPLQAIRRKCYECSNNQYWEIRGCQVKECPLYKFRNGHVPKKENDSLSEQISMDSIDEKL